MAKCENCGRTLANSVFRIKEKMYCPICILGSKEGSQSKYWETSTAPNAGKPQGFRYSDDTAKYDDEWDDTKKVWVKKK